MQNCIKLLNVEHESMITKTLLAVLTFVVYRACKNRACGHKLYTLQDISQYEDKIFAFCNLYCKAN